MRSRAVSLAAQLTALTGHEVRFEEACGRIRLTCALSPQLEERGRRLLLIALADADRYGHDVTAEGAQIWAVIAAEDEWPEPDATPSRGS
ncbi:hypothetical protein OKJ48_25620 [Streptomyces kunmingensis]|uniref:Uncharacterized protein n=1 Tax=Streptomyces kunmingensis TaxID=68225 RepID=A0ABU6CFV3_9ACTN|nr:hypothetical protein [Streptomyces kunmingensis]MEB3963593.1 hypothetical protein [Streptomyces kunmingensis]